MPPEDAAPVAAPVVTPPADQPPAPAAEKSFSERWRAAGGEEIAAAETDDGDDEGAPESPVVAPEPKSKPAAAAKPDAKRAQLESLARELGFAFDGNAVTVSERADFRLAKSKRERELDARERGIAEKELQANSSDRVKRADAILNAYEGGDPDGFAQALGAKDFNEFQQSFLKRLADPNYMELRKLQQWKEQQEAERVKAEQEGRTRQQQQQRAQALNAYMSTLSQTCQASSNPLVAAMHDDPLFLNAIYRIQEEHWDDSQQKTVTVEEAIKLAARGAKSKNLETELRTLFDRLSKGFGGSTPQLSVAPKNGKRPAPKTGVTPAVTVTGSGAAKGPGDMSPLEWRKYSLEKLNEADD